MAPLPLPAVKTFRSYSGLFWLCIECRECGRRSEIPAEDFARRLGRDAHVIVAVKRLRCKQCGGRWRIERFRRFAQRR